MRFRDTLHTAIKAITTNGRRSALTMLGIIIGVGSVVLMTSVGASMEQLILGQISSLGSKSMVIFPSHQHGPTGAAAGGMDTLTLEDIEALQDLETIESIAPIIFINGSVTYAREEASARIMGTNQYFFENQHIEAEQGRLLDKRDVYRAQHVVVLGADVNHELFGVNNGIGERVMIAGDRYTVIGVLESVGSQFFQNFDERVFVPLSVAKSVTGKKHADFVTLQATESFDLAFQDVKAVLRQHHGIVNPDDDPEKDDFTVRSSQQANDILGSVSLGLTLFITTIAAISLIVGGIGIMNIMLVAVTERTREIGLRKAVGAKRSDVLLQFLCEAVLLTLIAGVIGIVCGVLSALVTAQITQKFLDTYPFAISYPAIGVAMAMAACTGLLFGIYPARKAAGLPPMEALRYE